MPKVLFLILLVLSLSACSPSSEPAGDKNDYLVEEEQDGFDVISKENVGSLEGAPLEIESSENPFSSRPLEETPNPSKETIYTYKPSDEELEQPRLKGIMENIAVFEYSGKSYFVGRGEKVGTYKVMSVTSNQAVLVSPLEKVVLKLGEEG